MPDYSATTLAKKLGIKPGYRIRIIGQPNTYFDLFTDWPKNVTIAKDTNSTKQLIHYFTNNSKALFRQIPVLRREIFPNGMIWVSWYKKSSKMPSEISEDLIRQVALMNGLVDIKVCAIDEQWSGLKLVVPTRERQ